MKLTASVNTVAVLLALVVAAWDPIENRATKRSGERLRPEICVVLTAWTTELLGWPRRKRFWGGPLWIGKS